MSTKPPSTIYKSVSSCEHAEVLARGIVILRSIDFFRRHLCPDLKDFDEFSFQEPGRQVGYADTNALIFCAHKWKPRCKHHLVEIKDPCHLFKEIQLILNQSIKNAYFGEIFYKDSSVKGVPPISFYCDDVYTSFPDTERSEPGFQICYYKRPKYAHENEVRMCFFVCLEKLAKIKNSNIEVKFLGRFVGNDVGNIQNPVIRDVKELDFKCWKHKQPEIHYCQTGNDSTDSPNNAENYWRAENYWFEVHIKLPNSISNNFRNISHKP